MNARQAPDGMRWEKIQARNRLRRLRLFKGIRTEEFWAETDELLRAAVARKPCPSAKLGGSKDIKDMSGGH